MNKFFAALLLAATLITGSVHAEVQIGKPAPDYSFTDIGGTKYNLAQFKGQKTVVLEWTNPGCPFVKKFYNAGEMQRVQQEALKDTQVVWFSINSSAEGKEGYLTEAQAKDFIANNNGHATSYVLDHSGKFGKLYGAKTTPHMFVIAKDGTLAYQGAIDSIKGFDPSDIKKADNYVLKTLAALKDGKQPAVTSTEPYGCSVKYGD